MTRDLSDLEKDALLSFSEQKGHQYKSILKSCWLKSSYPGVSNDHAAALQRIRNEFGPVWLDANGNQCTSDRKTAITEKVRAFMDAIADQVTVPKNHYFFPPTPLDFNWNSNDIALSTRQVSAFIRNTTVETGNLDQFHAEFRYKHEDNSVHVFASSGNQFAGESKNMLDCADRNACFVYAYSPLEAAKKCAAVWNNALTHWQSENKQKSEFGSDSQGETEDETDDSEPCIALRMMRGDIKAKLVESNATDLGDKELDRVFGTNDASEACINQARLAREMGLTMDLIIKENELMLDRMAMNAAELAAREKAAEREAEIAALEKEAKREMDYPELDRSR